MQSRIDKAVEDRLPYRIELATTGGVTFKNNEGESLVQPRLYKGGKPFTTDVSWRWALDGVVTVGMQYLVKAKDIGETAVLTVAGYVGNTEVATTEITLTNLVEPTNLIIKTSSGNIFKNNLINNTLTATLWRGGKEIDKDGTEFSYIWTKTDADGEPDILWNQTHNYSQKTIEITQKDVFRRAQFECNIEPLG